MIRIAIVEDDPVEAKNLKEFLERYGSEKNKGFEISVFPEAVNFVSFYRPQYDIIFMDIDLPNLNGMSAAKKLRKKDEVVTIIFVTNLRQFAVEGYSVNALDFVVKPVRYTEFESLMNKALRQLSYKADKEVVISSANGVVRVSVSDILYVEVDKHRLIYHTTDGTRDRWGTLKEIEKELPKESFVRCNSGYLVNLRHVKKVEDEFVFVGSERLVISRAKRTEFISALTDYLQA